MSALTPAPMSLSLGSSSTSSSPTPSASASATVRNGLLDVGPMSLSAYSSSFCAFVERSSEYPAMNKLFDQMVAQRYKPSGHSNGTRGLRFLSVGGGDGSFDFEVMLRMRSAGIVFESYTCVEPSDDRFPQLALRYGATPEQAAKLDSSNAVVCYSAALGCTARLVKEYFGEHTQISSAAARLPSVSANSHEDGGFDLVLMSHCFYWFDDPNAVALHALSLVSRKPSDQCINGGNVIIFHQSAREGICAFFDHFTGTRLHFTKRPLADHGLGGQKLHAALKERKVDSDLFEDYSAVDFTDAIVGGDRHVMSELLSFFIQTPFQDLPADIQKEMEEFVKSKLRWRQSETDKDKRACEFQHDTCCLVLRQNSRSS